MLKQFPCLACHPTHVCLCSVYGDDFYTTGEPEVLDQVGAMITTRLKAKILPRVGPRASQEGTPKQEVVVERDGLLPAA